MTADLLNRLESGSGDDMALNIEIARIDPDMEDGMLIPAYTSSLDAALSLAERMLPGWRVVNLCEWDHEVLRARGPWTCDLKRAGTQDVLTTRAAKCPHAQTPARALLIALLRALEDHP